MEDAVARARCAACARDGPSWHGSGPFLVLHAYDDGSANASGLIAEQCRAHGVEAVPVTVDDAPRARLWAFTAIVFLLPTTYRTEEIRPTLTSYAEILDGYRTKRRDGLAERQRLAWYYRGVAIWVGPRALLNNPLLHRALRQSDARFFLEHGPVDVFDVFGSNSLVVDASETAHPNSTVERLLGELGTWGIRLEDATAIKELIEDWREKFDGTAYPTLNGTRDGLEFNLLELVLSGSINTALKRRLPDDRWDSFVNDASRACRIVIKDMQARFIEFHLPLHRSRRFRQEDVRVLYRLLRTAVNYLDSRRDEQPPESFADS